MKTLGRRTIAMIMSVIMILSCLAGMALSVSAETSGGFKYAILDDGTVEINGVYGESQKILTIPSEIDGKKVSRIGNRAFLECGFSDVKIPNSVTSIGEHAFYQCWGLTKITIPYGVEIIENSAFLGCWYVNEIIIPDSVKTIESYAFGDCYLVKKIHIPKNLTEIRSFAFAGLRGLESLEIPENIVSIEANAFCNSEKLKRVRIAKNVKTIDNSAFGDISTLLNNNFTVYGYAGSEAERYANKNNFSFIDMTSCDHSDLELINKKDATCTEYGYTGDIRCEKCGKITEVGSIIHPLGFVDENGDNICDNCGLKYNQTVDNSIESKIMELINIIAEFFKQVYDFINSLFNN